MLGLFTVLDWVDDQVLHHPWYRLCQFVSWGYYRFDRPGAPLRDFAQHVAEDRELLSGGMAEVAMNQGMRLYRCLACPSWPVTDNHEAFEAHVLSHQLELERQMDFWRKDLLFWSRWYIRWLPGAKTRRTLARIAFERWAGREQSYYRDATEAI